MPVTSVDRMIIALAGQIPVTNTRKTPSKEVRDPSGTPPKNSTIAEIGEKLVEMT